VKVRVSIHSPSASLRSLADSIPWRQADIYGGFYSGKNDHATFWATLQRLMPQWKGNEYTDFPRPEVLAELCAAERISVEDTAYVGHSVARDVLMAKRAGVFAIWAAYGAKHDNGSYAALVRISHWTSDEVAQERKLSAEAALIPPDFFARTSFRGVLAALSLDNDEERRAPFV
jgi:hypothetical protein